MNPLHWMFLKNQQIVDEAKYRSQAANNRRIVKRNLGKNHVLSNEQKMECRKFWSQYHKQFTPDFHDWYSSCTGVFDVRYVPDDIWFSRIDAYYNDRKAARYIDNKCLYERLFHGVKMPNTLCMRINGYWLDPELRLIELDKVRSNISRFEGLFVKKATNSFGGVEFIT